MKRMTALALALLCLLPMRAYAAPAEITVPSAILMEKTTGSILYEQETTAQYEPASVTKIMTLLLVMEAIDSGSLGWDDMVTASPHAISMGGSQIWLKENEQMSVRDMVKAVTVVSANDCAVALAEHVAGSEPAFVERMNQRAAELGMDRTTFKNCTGLPAEGHLTCALDIALMSRELILNHPSIREFTTIWMDTLRDGAFQLSNTNKLIFYYEGATGLKTGSTSKAKYCLSATASKDGIDLIAVVMGAPDNKVRFQDAMALLNYGFSVSNIYVDENKESLPVQRIKGGVEDTVNLSFAGEFRYLDTKGSNLSQIEKTISLPEEIEAPVEEGQPIGEAVYKLDGQRIGGVSIVAARAVEKAGYKDYVLKVIYDFLL